MITNKGYVGNSLKAGMLYKIICFKETNGKSLREFKRYAIRWWWIVDAR